MLEVVLLLLLACAAGERTVGVCWTRNEVPATAPLDAEPWREVRASAVTLRAFHPTLATCLFTNAPRSAVDGAMDALGRRFGASEVGGPAPRSLFTRVVAQPDPAVALAGYPGFRRIAAMNASLASGDAARSADFWTKIKSRVMCIYNVRAAPFDVTLFVDGDTVFCPSADLGARLLMFGGGAPDVRFVPQSASKGTRADAVVEARRLAATARCADVAGDYAACWDGSPAFRAAAARGGADAAPPRGERPCPSLALKGSSRRQRLQSGAILARRGAPLDAFVDAWLAKYLDAYGAAAEGAVADADGSLGSDQPPLRSVVRDRCLRPSNASWVPGALPAAFNARFVTVPGGAFTTAAADAAFPGSRWAGALDGPAAVLHSHAYHAWQDLAVGVVAQTASLCAAMNAEPGVRIYRDAVLAGRHVAAVNATLPFF